MKEQDPGGGGPDTCYRSDLNIDPFTSVSGGTWVVNSGNIWAHDWIGYWPENVIKYRDAGQAPCGTSFPQEMLIDCGSVWVIYTNHTLRAGFDELMVWSERGGCLSTKDLAMKLSRLIPVASVISMIFCVALGARQNETIAVDHPRPLAEALRIFQDKYGWIVTYEDPQFGPQDVVDVTDKMRNPSAIRPGYRIYAPRGGPLSVTFTEPSPTSSTSDIATLLRAFVARHEAAGYPGRFRVFETDDIIHIVPHESILDTRVSLPARQNRDLVITLRTLFSALRAATGKEVVFGSAPANLLMQTRFDAAIGDSSARDILARVLRATGRGLSWRVLYSLEDQQYAVNIRIVNTPRP